MVVARIQNTFAGLTLFLFFNCVSQAERHAQIDCLSMAAY